MHLPTHFLIQMSGAPGSGKSTLSALLARPLTATIINHDLLRSFFLNNSNTFEQAARLSYDLQFALASDILKQGKSVIIDSTCNFPETLEQGRNIATEQGVRYLYVECRVTDIEVLERRLRERNPLRSQRAGVENGPAAAKGSGEEGGGYKLFERWIEHPCRPEEGVIVIDATKSPDECLGVVLERIGALTDVQ